MLIVSILLSDPQRVGGHLTSPTHSSTLYTSLVAPLSNDRQLKSTDRWCKQWHRWDSVPSSCPTTTTSSTIAIQPYTIALKVLQPQSLAIMSTMQQPFNEAIGSPTFSSYSLSPSEPETLPQFVFPMKPEPGTSTSSPTLDSVTSASQRKRSLSKSRPQHISINAPPPFEFNPSSASSPATLSPTPPRSPNKAAPHPSRVGHRRGGSEFIGGDGNADGPGLMSTSPTKGEGMLPPPPLASRSGPPSGRRGHAHRRSGAVSSHDISNIIRPSNVDASRAESAPTTPSEPGIMQQYLPNHDKASSQPSLLPATIQPPSPVSRHASLPSVGHARPRVGFSDTLEFIPRPLSTISSETSSSFSTIRPGHSVTGSISSVVSGGTSSPPSARASRTSHDLPRVDEGTRARPSTASASLDSPSMKSVMRAEGGRKRPSSASGSPSSNGGKRGVISFSTGQAPSTEIMYKPDMLETPKSPRLGEDMKKLARMHNDKPGPAVVDGRVKTQRKVKSWAGSILNKKGKSTSAVDASRPRPPTPPLRSFASAEDFSLDDLNFDGEEDTSAALPTQPARIDFSTWKPRQTSPRLPSDTFSPTLDLDAAMGPFNTPTMGSDSDQSSGSGFSAAKRRMHSAGATGAFTGPGMHYHRRAESAPEMAPVTDVVFDAYHAGSTNAMADVFEEEEEEDDRDQTTADSRDGAERTNGEQQHGLGVKVADPKASSSTVHGRRQRKRLENLDNARPATQSPTLGRPSTSTPVSFDFPVEIVDATEEPRFSVVTKSSDESTITPTLSTNAVRAPNPISNEFAFPSFPSGLSAPSETASSVLSSPDFTNTSFDVPRLNTAHSSITDRTAWSISKASERGSHEQSYPADDVPSLTSSESFMTHPSRVSNSGHSSQQPPPNPSPYTVDCRSASLSAMATLGNSRPASPNKRSSLASLSRLIGSSHGEKSKLSIESMATEEGEGTQRKKRNRISRLMKFWKSKEKQGQA